jgi:hypothetical protein
VVRHPISNACTSNKGKFYRTTRRLVKDVRVTARRKSPKNETRPTK